MTSHLSRDQLLRHLDGELSRFATRRTTAHLRACWSCQVELERLKQHIAVIVDAEAELFGSSLPSPPMPWPRIEARLEKAKGSRMSSWRKLFPFTARPRMSLAFATPTLALLLVGILIWAPLARVSAKEVLSKAIAADTARQSTTLQQVVKQKVRIRKTTVGGGERTAALESWRSTKSAYWNSASDPVNIQLLGRYQANGLASALPLSPAAVESWIKLAGSEPSASSEGQYVAVEVVGNPAGQARGLRAVRFHVQTESWHMDQMTLSFADATFQISEEESSILDQRGVPNEILTALGLNVDSPLPTSRPALPASSTVAPALTGESTPVNLDDLEIEVRYALHGLGADLGEGVEITARPPNQLVINAPNVSPSRKEQLKALLGNKQGVRLSFENSANDTVPRGTAAKTMVAPGAEQSRQTPDTRLSQYFGSLTEQDDYARSVLETTTDILAHLYALRELAGRWPSSSDGSLSADSKTKLTVMLRDHARELRTGTSKLQKDLTLILKGEQTKSQPTAPGGIRWQNASASGLDAASTIDRSLRALLTVSDAPLSLNQALPKLQQGSRDLKLAVDELTKSVE
jgi:anti-sigma factor RsiW